LTCRWADRITVFGIAQVIGAFIGAALVWLAWMDHFEATDDPGLKLVTSVDYSGHPQSS
jgi:glycerol uptake facilitator protein